MKNQAQTEEFLQTEAYSDLFIEFMNNPDEFSKFFAGVLNFDTNVQAEVAAPVLMPMT